MYNKEKIINSFDRAASSYESYGDAQRLSSRHLSSYLPVLPPGSDILEIGCGTGFFTRYLLSIYQDSFLTISDLSPLMVAYCRERYGGAIPRRSGSTSFRVMDGEFPDIEGKFDLIVASMAMQWFENFPLSLERLCCFLKQNGRLLFSVPGKDCFCEWRDILARLGLGNGIHAIESTPGLVGESRFSVRYKNGLDFIRMFRRTGAHSPRFIHDSLSVSAFKEACHIFEEEYNSCATWHILYAVNFCGHGSGKKV